MVRKFGVLIIVILLIFISMLALSRLLVPEIYLLAIVSLAVIVSVAIMKRDTFHFLSSILVTYVAICLSWSLASGFTAPPRSDIYHYYPYTRFIYESGHITHSGAGEEFERIFINTIAPWPAWHILLASFSHITSLDLLYVVQLIQPLVMAPLVILMSFNIGKILAHNEKDKTKVFTNYLLAIMLPFLSFYVFYNTNPVSRSFASGLYLLVVYTLFRIIMGQDKSSNIILIISLICITYTHPYWSLAVPLVILLVFVLSLFIDRLVVRDQGNDYKVLLMTPLAILITSATWIIYYTYTFKVSMMHALRTFLTLGWKDILSLDILTTHLEASSMQEEFFKVHPLEPIIYWLVWATDLIPIVVAAPSLFFALSAIINRKLNKLWMLTFILAISSILVTIFTVAPTTGLRQHYAVTMIYLPLTMLASLTVSRLLGESYNRKLTTKIIITFIVLLFIIVSSLSLGTRGYQASFIWSHDISFEDKGLHSTHGKPLMDFCNRYCNYNTFSDILTDDPVVRVHLNTSIFLELSKSVGTMPPRHYCGFLDITKHNVLLISVRSFKPMYGHLIDQIWYGIDPRRCEEIVKSLVYSRSLRLYDNSYSQLFYLP